MSNEAETPNLITLDLVGVQIDRGKTVICKAVPEHEVRVLKAMHGAGKVTKTELAADMEPTADYYANAHMEFGRLENCYRSKDGSPVALAFPGGAEDLVAFGFELGREGELSEQPRSVSVNHGLAERQQAAKERKAKEPKGGKAK